MNRFPGIILVTIMTSFFLFPFNLPITGVEINTKMIIAVFGLLLLIIDMVGEKGPNLSKEFVILSLICAVISIWAYLITLWNNTPDYTFSKYLISVWVWLGAAYAVVRMMDWVHKEATVEIVGNYLIAVCVFQCALAYSMTIWPPLATFIDSLMGDGEAFMSATDNRMHGLGAALDPAGLRFSAVLVILSFLMARTDFNTAPWKGILYILSFCLITIIGNMIARTSTVGVVLAIITFLILRRPRKGELRVDRSWGIIAASLLIVTLVSIFLYRTNPGFRANIRFGFEGFFSLVEKGRWEVRSNDILKNMIVWPETARTWLIGDGYFDNPQDLPDRFGHIYSGYYMRTDIGYLRYIFYFGSIGLIGMLSVFVYMTYTSILHLDGCTVLFLMLLMVNMLGWMKVSSDIIMVFAPFLILAYKKAGETETACA